MNIRNIIFDMDGTLINSMGYWHRIGSIYLKKHGITPEDPDFDYKFFAKLRDSGIEMMEAYGLRFQGYEDYIDQLYRLMGECYREAEVLPGVPEFLREMKKRGIKMCIATATRADISTPVAERLGLLPEMEFLICCDEVGAGKQKPDVYLEAARRMGGTPADTAVFEDSLYCIKTAVKAGFYTVGIEDTTAKPKDLARARQLANRYIRSYSELL